MLSKEFYSNLNYLSNSVEKGRIAAAEKDFNRTQPEDFSTFTISCTIKIYNVSVADGWQMDEFGIFARPYDIKYISSVQRVGKTDYRIEAFAWADVKDIEKELERLILPF